MTTAATWAQRFNRRRLRVTPVERIRSAAEMRTIEFVKETAWWLFGWAA